MARAAAWSLLQVACFVLVYEVGRDAWSAFHEMRPDLGRGILTFHYVCGFVGLAIVANGVLAVERVGSVRWRRAAVWAAVLIPLLVFTLPSGPHLPVAVPFLHGCALASILVREGLAIARDR